MRKSILHKKCSDHSTPHMTHGYRKDGNTSTFSYAAWQYSTPGRHIRPTPLSTYLLVYLYTGSPVYLYVHIRCTHPVDPFAHSLADDLPSTTHLYILVQATRPVRLSTYVLLHTSTQVLPNLVPSPSLPLLCLG